MIAPNSPQSISSSPVLINQARDSNDAKEQPEGQGGQRQIAQTFFFSVGEPNIQASQSTHV